MSELDKELQPAKRAICKDNSDYPASLEVGTSYQVLTDVSLDADWIRVVDESGEGYLYPACYFTLE